MSKHIFVLRKTKMSVFNRRRAYTLPARGVSTAELAAFRFAEQSQAHEPSFKVTKAPESLTRRKCLGRKVDLKIPACLAVTDIFRDRTRVPPSQPRS